MRKIIFALTIFSMSVFSASSQSREADILTFLTSATPAQEDDASPLDFISGDTSALDFISPSASERKQAKETAGGSFSALDFVMTSGNADVNKADDTLMALISSMSPQMGALNYVSPVNSMYRQTGVYRSQGALGSQASSSYFGSSNIPYYCPEWGRITSGFGYRERFHRMHKGIDIAMKVGDTVRVALPGVVEKVSFELNGYGNYVVVSHDNGMETRYAHLSQSLVVPGMRVLTGEPIALSGNTGNSTGPHLHFEARLNGVAVDPTTVFDFSGKSGYYASASQVPYQTGQIGSGRKGAELAGKSTYIVRQGDTPKKIASRAGISVLRLCQLNFIMEDEVLQTGRMLKLR